MVYGIIILAFLLMILIGVPIAFVLGLIGLISLLLTHGFRFLSAIPRQVFMGMNSFVLMAIPFFILAGELMNKAKITDYIVDLSKLLIGRLKGGLGHVNILASIFFAGISGAATADVAALGTMLIPAMKKAGYSKPYATAITAASSIIGPTIPPSIPLVIFGSMMNISIAGLFAAGFLPGILMGLAMMAVNYYISVKRGYELNPEQLVEFLDNKSKIKIVLNGSIALLMPIIILGGILGGIFTPTEAAAVAVGYAVIIGLFVFKTLNMIIIWKVLKKTVIITGVSMLLVSTGRILSWFLTIERIPNNIANHVLSLAQTDYIFLSITAVLLLIVGMFNDLTASIIILGPILTPIAINFGIDPLHFGIVMVLALNIGLNTPPVGGILFLSSSISGVSMEKIVKELTPFLICEVFTLVVAIFWTPLSMTIPKLLGLD